jgi:hypothetical protein
MSARAQNGRIGIPDLGPLGKRAVLVEWQTFADQTVDPRFAERLTSELGALGVQLDDDLFFICRSGSRSLAAAKAMATEKTMGMMIIRHKVRDDGQWRPIFDAHAEVQKTAGLSNPRVYHSADSNKSEIVVVFDTKQTKMAKDFAASVELKEAMTKAGVVDTPTIYFLESTD